MSHILYDFPIRQDIDFITVEPERLVLFITVVTESGTGLALVLAPSMARFLRDELGRALTHFPKE